jgi:hypothetical protein
LKDVDDSDLRTNHFQLEGDDMHHDSNMEGADFNVYGHSANGELGQNRYKVL